MPTALYRLLLVCLLLLPLAAQASEAEDFVAANSNQQAQLLETWAAQPDPARLELLNALQRGQLNIAGESRTLRLNNRLRGLIDSALASHQLLASDANSRLAAARQLQKSAKPAQLKFLDARLAAEQAPDVHDALSLALANLQLVDSDPAVRLAAVRLLGETGDPLARTRAWFRHRHEGVQCLHRYASHAGPIPQGVSGRAAGHARHHHHDGISHQQQPLLP